MTPIVRPLSRAVLACIALALPASLPASASAAAPCPDAELVPVATNMAQVKTATLCLLNVERRTRGRAPLTSNGQLGKAALAYSAKMVRMRFFDHVCPQGTTPSSRIRGGTNYLRGRARNWSLGENIAWGSGELATPEAIVRSWMHSAGHRRNILDRHFRNIGIGIASGAPDDVRGQPAATYTTDFGFRGFG